MSHVQNLFFTQNTSFRVMSKPLETVWNQELMVEVAKMVESQASNLVRRKEKISQKLPFSLIFPLKFVLLKACRNLLCENVF